MKFRTSFGQVDTSAPLKEHTEENLWQKIRKYDARAKVVHVRFGQDRQDRMESHQHKWKHWSRYITDDVQHKDRFDDEEYEGNSSWII